MENKYDLIIIGAGPGGTDAAEEAAKYGLKTAIIEKNHMGGTCLNRGCIPTKTILHTAEIYRQAKEGEKLGISGQSRMNIDAAALQRHKSKILEDLRAGLTFTLEHAGVEIINGTGTILDRHHVKAGDTVLETENILIASGSVPGRPPIEGSDLPGVITSDEMLSLTYVPESLVIVGGGVIGMEFAAIYESFGSHVTVIESLKRVLCNFDKEISRNLSMILGKRGVDIHTNANITKIDRSGDLLQCTYEEKGQSCQAEGELILMAAGRRPYTEGLFSDETDPEVRAIKMEKGHIITDSCQETSVPGIYAIGDVTDGIQLAHAASAAGRNAAAAIAGKAPVMSMDYVPFCVYTDPEIASVGMTADSAKEAGQKVITKKYPMSSNGKSVLTMQDRGFIKIIADPETKKILGAQMMCARATDMVTQFSQAIEWGMCLDDIAKILYPHPTFCEGIGKAAGK